MANAMGQGNYGLPGSAGTSSAGQNFMSTLIARMPYTYKVLQNALAQNPKYDVFAKLTSRPDVRVQQQSIFQQQLGGPAGHMMIDKRYHQFMYADVDVDKVRRIQEYRRMAAYSEMADAIDEIADEAIVKDKDDNIVNCYIKGDYDRVIVDGLQKEWNRFINIFDLEMKGWELFRKFLIEGELFMENIISENRPDHGIIGIASIPGELINPIYDNVQNQILQGFLLRKPILDPKSTMTNQSREELITLDKNQVTYCHSGLWNEDHTIRIPFIENARRAYKQLSLVEDSIIIYRLVRAPERLVFKVDVGTMPVPKAEEYVRSLMQQYWTKKNFDSSQSRPTNIYDPQSMLDAYWFTKRGQSEGTTVEQLAGGCLAMDTKVPLLDGRELTLTEMTKEYKEGKQNWVYSCDPKTGHIVPGKVSWAGVTQKSAKVMRLTFDNGEKIVCTPDHKFPTICKGKVRADELEINDSIYSTQRKKMKIRGVKNTYEHIYHHDTKQWEPTHRMVANYLDKKYVKDFVFEQSNIRQRGKKLFDTIHHVDVNRYNNSPENLVWMNFNDHIKMHSVTSTPEMNKKISQGMRRYIDNLSVEDRKARAEICKINRRKGNDKYKELLKNPEYFVKISKNKPVAVTNALKDPKKRSRKSEINRDRWANNSEYRDIMAKSNSERWNNSGFRDKTSANMSFRFTENALKALVDLIKNTNITQQNEIVNYINENSDNKFSQQFNLDNSGFKGWKGKIKLDTIKKLVNHFGYKNYAQFRKEISLYNHNVVKIEYLDQKIEVGTLTIDQNEEIHNFHTFLTCSGVITYNSNLGQLDDLMYFVKKLYKSLKVPTQRLDPENPFQDGEQITREELRFAKFIIRIQQQIAYGFKQSFIAHLKLREKKKDDPDSKSIWERFELREHELKIEFNMPSSFAVMREQQIFDLKKNNFTGLASTELMSQSFCQKHYLGMTTQEMAENREWLRKDAALSWEIQQIIANGPNFREKLEMEAEMMGQDVGGGMPPGGGTALPGGEDEFQPELPPEFGPAPESPEQATQGAAPEGGQTPEQSGLPPQQG